VRKTLAAERGVCFISRGLQRLRKIVRQVAAPALAGVLVLLLFWSAALAGTSHQQHHPLSASPDHHLCAICLFASGQVLASDVTPPRPVRPLEEMVVLVSSQFGSPAGMHFALPEERAPPAASLHFA